MKQLKSQKSFGVAVYTKIAMLKPVAILFQFLSIKLMLMLLLSIANRIMI